MPVKLHKRPAETTWIPVDLGAGESIEIQTRRPTYGEQLRVHALATASYRDPTGQTAATLAEFRLETAIANWRGVEDEDGKPVPYNAKALQALCSDRPGLLYLLINLASDQFATLQETETKNSPTPSHPSSTAPNPTTTAPTST